jgi:translation elongation factor EF-Tu-like GTPase
MEGKQEVGRVTHFYPKILVAVVELKLPLATGDRIEIVGRNTHFEQIVESMQIEHKTITSARAGQSIGLKVADRVREEDVVYR